MPIQTETYDIDDEIERLESEMDTLGEEQLDQPNDSPLQQDLFDRGAQLQRYVGILDHVSTAWDVDSVTLAGLAPGEINRIQDTADEHPDVRVRDCWVALGTVDAGLPYVNHDPDEIEDAAYIETIQAVVDETPIAFVRWAEERINDLTHPGSEGNEYRRLLAAKQAERMSTSTNGSPTSEPSP